MLRQDNGRSIPIYSSRGEWSAVMIYPYLFNTQGEWIGWVAEDRQVYDIQGSYVGWLTREARILRQRTPHMLGGGRMPPSAPGRIRPPANVPLPPMMSELPFGVIDVLADQPGLLHTIDTGALKEDMD